MAHASHHDEIEPPGKFEVPKGFLIAGIVLVAIGVIGFAIGLLNAPERAWRGYIIGFWFTLALAMAGPFFIGTQYLSKAGWSVSIRRIPEAMGTYIYPAILLAVVALLFGVDSLFGWLDPSVLDPNDSHFDEIVADKAGFLNRTNLWIFTLVPMSIVAIFFFLMRKNSVDQDEAGGYKRMHRNLWISAFYIISFAICVSFFAWYWLMSYDPHWYSMMWSVYAFAGLFQSGLSVMVLILLYLMGRKLFGGTVGTEQVHRLGQLVFAFTVFYAYIHFSQFLLLWYANIPETAKWYTDRMSEGWGPVLLMLPLLKFIVPFLALLRQDAKKNKKNVLATICVLLIVMQIVEIWLWVMPYWYNMEAFYGLTSPMVPIYELPVVLGFIGLFMIVVAKSLARHNLVPIKDPLLHEAIPHSHDHLIYPEGKPGDIGLTPNH